MNSFVTVCGDEARERATALESFDADERERLPLLGVPVALKDNIATRGVRTTCASPILESWVPESDADLVVALERAGAIVIGKLNMHQFALRSAHPQYGEVRNPWDTSTSCSGSSSGSGAAAAAGLAPVTFGTDTAGSLRLPAAACGVVGLKPTYGRLSTSGIFPGAPSLDHVGPLTRTSEDALAVLHAISPSAAPRGPADLRGLKVGAVRAQPDVAIDDELATACEAALAQLRDAGAEVREVELPSLPSLRALGRTLSSPQVAAVHQRYLRTSPEAYSPDVRQQILIGAALPASEYVKALEARDRVVATFEDLMRDLDVLVLPAVPLPAWPVAADDPRMTARCAELLAGLTLYCAPFNLTGQPAVSIPYGTSAAGLPLSFQLVGRCGEDEALLRAAAAFEQIAPPPRLDVTA